MPDIEQLSLFEPRSEIPELEALGLRAESLLYRPRGQRSGGVLALYVFGRGLVEHGGTLEAIGFRHDPNLGGFYRVKPVDEQRLLLALNTRPSVVSEVDDAVKPTDAPAGGPKPQTIAPRQPAVPGSPSSPRMGGTAPVAPVGRESAAPAGIFAGWNGGTRPVAAPSETRDNTPSNAGVAGKSAPADERVLAQETVITTGETPNNQQAGIQPSVPALENGSAQGGTEAGHDAPAMATAADRGATPPADLVVGPAPTSESNPAGELGTHPEIVAPTTVTTPADGPVASALPTVAVTLPSEGTNIVADAVASPAVAVMLGDSAAAQGQRAVLELDVEDRLMARRRQAARAATSSAGVHTLGVNGLGHLVYETKAGERFYREKDGSEVFEAQADMPGQFFRVTQSSDLVDIARGILYQPVHGQAISVDDLNEVVAAVRVTNRAVSRDLVLDAVWDAAQAMLDGTGSAQQARALVGRIHRLTQTSFGVARGARPSLPIMNLEREIGATTTIDIAPEASIVDADVLSAIPNEESRVLLRVSGIDRARINLRGMLGQIPAHCVVEGAVAVDNPLTPTAQLFVVIGGRRPEPVDPALIPDQAFDVVQARDPEGLIACLDAIRVAKENTSIWFDRIRRGEPVDDLFEAPQAPVSQVLYTPMSRAKADGLFVPVNLAGPTLEAQEGFKARHGDDVDGYVADNMGMPTDVLMQRNTAEQIDTIAFGLDCHERGLAVLVGNGTGTGKGQIGASIIHTKVHAGGRVLVLTESFAGIGTLLRDMRNVGVLEGKRMMLINAGTEAQDAATGAVVFEKQPVRAIRDRCFVDDEPVWPEDVDIIFGTYSQFNRTAETSWRIRWLDAVIDDRVSTVFDEAHVVASSSANWSENMINCLSKAKDVTYITATWVGSSDKASVYYRLLGKDLRPGDADRIPDTLAKGGEPAQDAFGAMLARNGVMVRLESSMADIQMQLVASPNVDKNRALYDKIAPVFTEMMRYSRAIKRNATIHAEAELAALSRDVEAQRRVFGEMLAAAGQRNNAANQVGDRTMWQRVRANSKMRTMSFGSPLFRLSRAIMAAVMVEDEHGVVEQAIERVRDGMKPVLVFAETADALVQDVVKQAKEAGIAVPETPDFKHMLRSALRVAGRAHRRDGVVIAIDDPDLVVPSNDERELAAEIIHSVADVFQDQITRQVFRFDPEDKAGSVERLEYAMLERGREASQNVVAAVNAERGGEGQPLLDAQAVENYLTLAVRNTFITTRTDGLDLVARFRTQADALEKQAEDVIGRRRAIEMMIDALPDIPMTFIDRARRKMENAGIRVGEITGRQFTVNEDGTVDRRVRERTDVAARKFNSGEYNALIMNAAGASQIDLHAAIQFADQSQRCLMIIQTLPGAVMTQIAGRVSRRGQVVNPRLEMHVTGLPVTYRFIAALNQQCERLGANVSAIRKHPLMCDAIAPILTQSGDIATARFLLNNPDLKETLEVDATTEYLTEKAALFGNSMAAEEEDTGGVGERIPNRFDTGQKHLAAATRDNRRLANEVLARSTCFSTDIQSQVIRLIEAEYWAWMEERAAMGIYTGAQHEIEGEVTRRLSVPLDPGDLHLPLDRRSAFEAPLYLEAIAIETVTKPMRSSDVKGLIAAANGRGDDNLLRRFEETARSGGARVRLEDGDMLRAIDEFNHERDNRAAERLSGLRIGGGLRIVVDGEYVDGLIIGCNGTDWIDGSLKLVWPGASKPQDVRLISVVNMALLYQIGDGLHGPDRKAVLNAYDDVAGRRRIKSRWALTGNLWKALQINPGRVVSWGGGEHSGVLIPKNRFVPTAVSTAVTSVDKCIQDIHRDDENAEIASKSVAIIIELRPQISGIGSGAYLRIMPQKRGGTPQYAAELVDISSINQGVSPTFTFRQFEDLLQFLSGPLRGVLPEKFEAEGRQMFNKFHEKLAEIPILQAEQRAGRQLTRDEARLVASRGSLEMSLRFGEKISTGYRAGLPESAVRAVLDKALARSMNVFARTQYPSLAYQRTEDWVLEGGSMPPRLRHAIRSIPGAAVIEMSPLERAPAPNAQEQPKTSEAGKRPAQQSNLAPAAE